MLCCFENDSKSPLRICSVTFMVCLEHYKSCAETLFLLYLARVWVAVTFHSISRDLTRSGDTNSEWRQGIFPRRFIDESSTRNEHQGPIIFPISSWPLLPVSVSQDDHAGRQGTCFQGIVLLCRTGGTHQLLGKISRWRPRIAQIATVTCKVSTVTQWKSVFHYHYFWFYDSRSCESSYKVIMTPTNLIPSPTPR